MKLRINFSIPKEEQGIFPHEKQLVSLKDIFIDDTLPHNKKILNQR